MKSSAVTKHYCPRGGADLLWRCQSPEILYDGPAGTGKTRAVLEKANLAALKYDNARILIARKTRASMTQSALVTFEDKVCPRWPWVRNIKRTHRESYSYPNGAEIVVGGLDKPERILSTEYDMIVVHQAEEITENDWEMLLTRLRNGVMPYQQAIAECNPGPPKHWIKQRADDNRMRRILSRHSDNPSVTEDYLERLSKLTGHRRARLFQGKWAAAEGLIYECFDEAIHVREEHGTPVRAIIGVDEGFSNPCSMHLYLADSDGRVHAAREFYLSKQLEEPIIGCVKQWIRAVRKAYGLDVEAIVVDPSAAKLIAAMERIQLPVTQADNEVFGGIRNVLNYMAVQGDDLPRFTCAPRCVAMRNEFSSYQWSKTASGEQKDSPQKQNDHSMDELRYGLKHFANTSGSMEILAL